MSEISINGNSRRPLPKQILLLLSLVLLVVLYLPVISGLVKQWIDDPNYQHGIVIPLVSAFILWKRREKLREYSCEKASYTGLLLVIVSAVAFIAGTAAAEIFSTRISFPLMIFGSLIFLMGRKVSGIVAFPVLLPILAVPLPYIIYYRITFPMQLMSARLSAYILGSTGVSVLRKGNILHLPGYTLEVVAACSGLRSLMTMVTIAAIMTVFSGFSRTRNVLLVALSIPVAIAANTIRLTVTALGAYTIGPEFADGTIHQISGLIVFASGFLLLLLAYRILKWKK